MKAAIVRQAGQAPVYADFPDPEPAAGEVRVTVTAAALSQVVKSRAAGSHYSASGQFPLVPGVDGVGHLDDGRRVLFFGARAPYGTMAQYAAVPLTHCIALPEDLDDISAAAIANPGVSSWAAYAGRAQLRAGETVLVNGATGAAGRLAVQIAKHLGASKVIATGRNLQALESLRALGADVVIPLGTDLAAAGQALEHQFAQGIDIVIDYLWGQSAETLLATAARFGPEAVPIRFVQIGAVSGQNITLPSAVLRSSAIDLMGSGLGSLPLPRLLGYIDALLHAAVPAGLGIATRPVPLSDVETSWASSDSASRMVFTIGP